MFNLNNQKHARYTALPSWDDLVAYLQDSSRKPSVSSLLEDARQNEKTLLQPRCGVGQHSQMKDLLELIDRDGRPDILTITIDSYTRLTKFKSVKSILQTDPKQLNGYPLVNHGFVNGRDLDNQIKTPLQIRHGSPDARHLFEVSLASGITSFEGGGISYNIPYCKTIPIKDSLRYWNYVDVLSGSLSDQGIVIDREFFGTLTAVLMPPSISLSITLLEALLAAKEGVQCFSVAYPQGGNLIQDVAALKAIQRIFPMFLPKGSKIYSVLHGYMGPFPVKRGDAESLIFLSAVIARLGKANKLVYKTCEEAVALPSGEENSIAANISRQALDYEFELSKEQEKLVEIEIQQIEKEILEIVSPLLDGKDLADQICAAFIKGLLDVPFSSNNQVHSSVIPLRDEEGAIRYYDCGKLPLSRETIAWNKDKIGSKNTSQSAVLSQLEEDICFFQQKNRHIILSQIRT